jgi:hypothetical protein
MARRRPRARRRLSAPPLGELIGRDPRVLALLDRYGITFCAGCYLTLFSSPERAAVYHAVPHPRRFVTELEALLKRPKRRG